MVAFVITPKDFNQRFYHDIHAVVLLCGYFSPVGKDGFGLELPKVCILRTDFNEVERSYSELYSH